MQVSSMRASILFLTNAYPDFDSSYRGHFIKKIALLLQKDGYKISIVTPKIYNGSQYFEEQEGIRVYRFPFFAHNKLLIEYKKIPYLKMGLYLLSGFLHTIYAMFKFKCDLMHVHWVLPTGLVGMVVSGLIRKPYIVTIHGSDFRMAMSKRFLLKIFLHICKKAQHITCVSEVQKKEIERLGIDDEKISVFPMCIDENFLEIGRKREKDLERRAFAVVSNRTLLPIYNVSLLIRAIPLVLQEEPKTKFFIAGDGPERDHLEKEAKELNIYLSVQFLGRVPHEEMAALLAQSDVYVSTSLYDGTSVSLLEAMASGAFPIATDISVNREWITNGENGFLFPINQERLLAKKIIDAIRNQSLLEKSRKENLLIVREKALWPVNIRRVKEIYHEILSPKIGNGMRIA
jgi:glycosyltransferase involved in cell wall biosynthesis